MSDRSAERVVDGRGASGGDYDEVDEYAGIRDESLPDVLPLSSRTWGIRLLTAQQGEAAERAHAPEPLTLDQIGRGFWVTRERIRQIVSRTMERLRDRARSDGLREYLA